MKRLTPPRRRSPSERWNEPDADTCDRRAPLLMKRLTPPRRRSPSERWNEPDVDTCDPLSTPRRRSPSERWNETDPDTCNRRAPLLMLLHTHRQPRAALKLPSQDDKGRAAMVGDRRGHVTSMFSIPLRACCTPRCDVDACRRRDDARGTRCGTPGGRSPTPNCDGGSYASQPIAPAGTAAPGLGEWCRLHCHCSHLFLRARCTLRYLFGGFLPPEGSYFE